MTDVNYMRPAYPCPECGAATSYYSECPGYYGRGERAGTIMVCSPPCGNADEFRCSNEECRWWYRDPNRRSDRHEMGKAPPWLSEWQDPGEDSE